jgi:uncharacterized protein YegP (UPF0339 family)
MQFTIYKDNGGQFHWCLVSDAGARVAVSAMSFGSAGEAQRAAAEVQEHAATAGGTEH